MIRSGTDNTIEHKLEAMEWMARYIKFIPPMNIGAVCAEFKKYFMTPTPSPQRTALASISGHKSEGIETCIMNLRDNKSRMEKNPPEIDVQEYDRLNVLSL